TKESRLNPEYFHKPSLHFYLRMPVTYLALKIAEKRGVIRGYEEVVTSDPFGLARYAFSASPIESAIANRLLSMLLSLFTVLLIFQSARLLGATMITAHAA